MRYLVRFFPTQNSVANEKDAALVTYIIEEKHDVQRDAFEAFLDLIVANFGPTPGLVELCEAETPNCKPILAYTYEKQEFFGPMLAHSVDQPFTDVH